MATNNLVSEVTRSYNSFSGSDIRVSIGAQLFAELQGIHYSIHREKAPIYTMGSPDVRSFSRNKRAIMGGLTWATFDRHALLDLVRNQGGTFLANTDDLRPEYMVSQDSFLGDTAIFNSTVVRDDGLPAGATIDQTQVFNPSVFSTKEEATPWYSDQIPPFNVTIMAANEYGGGMAAKLFGCEILNEATGMSVDDAMADMQATFVARTVEQFSAISPNTVGTVASLT